MVSLSSERQQHSDDDNVDSNVLRIYFELNNSEHCLFVFHFI